MTRHLLNSRTAKHSELSSFHAFFHAVPLPESLLQPNHTFLNYTHLICFINYQLFPKTLGHLPPCHQLHPAPRPGLSIQLAVNKAGSKESSPTLNPTVNFPWNRPLRLDVTSSRLQPASVHPNINFPAHTILDSMAPSTQ